jgi:diacylglycerol kinase (ATP)
VIASSGTSDVYNSSMVVASASRHGRSKLSNITKVVSKKQQRKQAQTVLIVNPNSCSGLTGKNWDQLYDQIKQVLGKRSIKVAFSKRSGDGTRLARDYLRRGFTEIYAIGGDGTINEVANGFFEENMGIRNGIGKSNSPRLKPINPSAKLAIVPCGTRNVLVKSLDLPAGVVECCKNITSVNRSVKLDVIGVQATNKEDGSKTPMRIMLNAAEMGVAAEIIDRSKKVRNVVKSRIVSTITAVFSTLPAYESNLCTISLDNNPRKTFDTRMTMGVVANGRFLGGGFMAAPNADMSDGLLDVVILKDSGSLKMLDELVNLKSGDHFDDDNIMYAQAKTVSIKSKERNVTVTLDGEPIGVLPADFHIFHNALNVVA